MKYQEFMELFPRLKTKAQAIYDEYKDQNNNLLSSAMNSTTRKEYARGGLGFGLGYYWANPVKDCVLGGVHRGRLLKRISTLKKPDWEYLFDKDDVLIAAFENFTLYKAMHFILRDIDEYTWEISFDDDGSFNRVCITYYCNNQIEFELTFDTHSFEEIEEFLPLVSYEAWLFEHLEDGFIEAECVNYPLYPEKTREYISKFNWPLYLIRQVYKRHSDTISEANLYDHYEINETLGQCRFMGTYTFLKEQS